MRLAFLTSLVAVSALAQTPGIKRDLWGMATVPEWAKRTVLAIPLGATPADEKILAPNCEYPVKPAKFEAKPKILPAFDGKLTDRASYIRGLLSLINQFPEASSVAQKFLPLYESGEIEVLLVTKEALAQRSLAGANAFCEIRNGVRKIYIDKSAEVGDVLGIFYHELIHCVDDDIVRDLKQMEALMLDVVRTAMNMANAKQKNLSDATVQLSDFTAEEVAILQKMKRRVEQFDHIRTFRTERRAYDGEHAIGKWLLANQHSYYQTKGRAPSSFLSPIADDFIIERYGLDPQWIKKLQTGQCEPFTK